MKCQIYQSSLNEWKPTLFHLNSKDACVYELAFPDTEKLPFEVIEVVMKQSQSFPLYVYLETSESFVELFDDLRLQYDITYYKKTRAKDRWKIMFKINDSQQFQGMSPLVELLSNMEDLVFWSTNKQQFLTRNRWQGSGVHVNLEEGETLYYLPNAGTALAIFSKNTSFSTTEKVRALLPPERIK
ncbi:hypothetical protein QI30_04125 [Kurthia sp. 3B1D]|uniref:Uncharacterized protein n=1 Tax=Candidatus Kurthia intestinigallinarum TaxID=1562256 RepID=A0A433RWU1_9BACL|nr:hypothetical protein [Kurthia sp. 3B1D]RUS57750.1 hypothetical protein QI30_04125 [Kurthia sp. 3B1D]